MALTTIKTGAIADDAVTTDKLANAINSERTANTAKVSLANDAVTGAKIADEAINSEHLVSGSIDTAHIADNQITLAKMAGGTDGQIISYDANGDPVAVGPGTDGQVLTSTGAGSPPAFETLQGVPVGAIIMWNSTVASIPTGWVMCDGTNSTPDLRDRYIIGAKQDDSGVAKTNIAGTLQQTGGASSVTSGAGNAHGTAQNFIGGNELGVNNRGHGHPVTVIPPFFALVFIMKT